MDNISRKRSRDELEYDDGLEFIVSVCMLTCLIGIIGDWYGRKHCIRNLPMTDDDDRDYRRAIWMRSLLYDPSCFTQLRVNYRTFNRLCDLLRNEGGLVATKNVTINEIVALFLHVLSHNLKNSTIRTLFVRSGETVSRQFHTVLHAVLRIGKLLINQQSDQFFHERDIERWKWFPDAVGALDGIFIGLKVLAECRSRYRNRKGNISTNMLGACDANLKFLYVLPGWEGSASDARVLRDALQRPNGLKVYRDGYYLVDAGYTNGPGFLAPYRATRYHLKEWEGRTPENYKELFNYRHSSARNCIERTFGLLKMRWTILKDTSHYDVKTSIRIINACCILHNFIRNLMPSDPLLELVDRELQNRSMTDDEHGVEDQISSVGTAIGWTMFQDNLAVQMFEEYQGRRAHLN